MQSSSALTGALPLSPARDELPGAPLEEVPIGSHGRILALGLEADFADWLRAVGIEEGETIVVLRRALFGGPMHVRTSSGGEFALHRSLARAIRVARP